MAPILVLTYRRFPLSPSAYRPILLHPIVLMIGGHWAYAEVPEGDWVRDAFHLARHPYERLGHFSQGCVSAIVAWAVLLPCNPQCWRPGIAPTSQTRRDAPGWWFELLDQAGASSSGTQRR